MNMNLLPYYCWYKIKILLAWSVKKIIKKTPKSFTLAKLLETCQGINYFKIVVINNYHNYALVLGDQKTQSIRSVVSNAFFFILLVCTYGLNDIARHKLEHIRTISSIFHVKYRLIVNSTMYGQPLHKLWRRV